MFYKIFRLFCIIFSSNGEFYQIDYLSQQPVNMYNDCLLLGNVKNCRKEMQIFVYMWTKILYQGITKSNFSLHQLVIKSKVKQNKRNVKPDNVKRNVIYFHTIDYCDIQSCIACFTFCMSKGYFSTIFCNYIFYILDHEIVMLSRHILLMRN